MPPITVMIKPVSGACNMRCRYCFYADEMKNRACAVRPPMSLETLEIVVRRALAYAEGQANFIFQGGEPTLIGLDFYRRLIALENRYGGRNVEINNMLQTNGYALSDEMIAFFAENHFLLGVSLDGCPAAHDLMRPDARGAGTYARVEQTIERLEGAGAEYNILCVVNAEVAARADEALSALSKYRYLQFIPCLDALEGGAGDYALSPRAWGEFLIKAFDFYERAYNASRMVSIRNFDDWLRVMLGGEPASCAMIGHCSLNYLIESDGDVYPCDFYALDQWRLGSVKESNFLRLSGSETARRFIAESLSVPDECRACRYGALCRNGCRRERGADGKSRWCMSIQMLMDARLKRMERLARKMARGM